MEKQSAQKQNVDAGHDCTIFPALCCGINSLAYTLLDPQPICHPTLKQPAALYK